MQINPGPKTRCVFLWFSPLTGFPSRPSRWSPSFRSRRHERRKPPRGRPQDPPSGRRVSSRANSFKALAFSSMPIKGPDCRSIRALKLDAFSFGLVLMSDMHSTCRAPCACPIKSRVLTRRRVSKRCFPQRRRSEPRSPRCPAPLPPSGPLRPAGLRIPAAAPPSAWWWGAWG